METRLTNFYVPLNAFLPQMLRQTLAQIFSWACKTNLKGVQRDQEGGGLARDTISEDLC